MARFTGQYGRQYGGGNIRFLTPIHGEWWSGARLTFLIIIINFAIWLAITIASKFNPGIYKIAGEYLAISPTTTFGKLYLWTIVTHAFTHFDFMHCFFNMLFLFFFSPQIERDFGPRKFLFYYFLTAFGAALVSIIFKSIMAYIMRNYAYK